MSAVLTSPIGLRRGIVARQDSAVLPERCDVAVIGGGLIGLSIAWQLARAGRSVTVIERDAVGAGASLAATGMLAPAAEHEPGSDLLLPLALDSLGRWPEFRDELQADAGIGIDYREGGTLVLAIGRDEVERLRFRFDLQRRAGVAAEWVSGPEARVREPLLRPNVSAGIHCPRDAQVDPRLVMQALVHANERTGVTIVERCAVHEIAHANDHSSARIACTLGTLRAGTVILATGAWSGQRGLLPDSEGLPVRPIKGQSLALKTTRRTGTLSSMVWTDQIHMAPKSDGTLVVGATVEDCGFREGVTAGGLFALLESARRVLPGIEEMEVEAVWSGFRPTSDDDAPIIDVLPNGVIVATGHHRNGYLLAPSTAYAVAELVERGSLPDYARGFGLGRFAQGSQEQQLRARA